MTLRRLALALTLAFAAAPSFAETTVIAGREVALPVPKGYCTLDTRPEEARWLDRLRQGIGPNGHLVQAFADCAELAASRAAPANSAVPGFERYGTFMVPVRDGQPMVFDGMPRERFLQLLAKGASNGPAVAERIAAAEARLRALKADFQQTESLGVLDTDAQGVYIGVTGTAAAPLKGRFLAVGGATLVRGRNVTVTLYQTYSRDEDLPALLATQKGNVAALVAANP